MKKLPFANEGQQQAIKRLLASPDAPALLDLLKTQRDFNARVAIWDEEADARNTARARAQCYEVLTNTLENV